MTRAEVKEYLDEMEVRYNRPDFIQNDPILLPHGFTKKEDIEIIGFLVASLAWGQRITIINNGKRLIEWMEHAPYDFIMNHEASDLDRFDGFVHRTFNSIDCRYFMTALQHFYTQLGGLEKVFTDLSNEHPTAEVLSQFKQTFFSLPHEKRTEKHVADPMRGSTAKRLNMYRLSLPLDVHTGNVARKLKLLKRKQNDWRAVEEIDKVLRRFDPVDPCRYDFALFGLGVEGVFK